MDNPTTKPCSACGEIKPLDAFSIDRRQTLGRRGRCRLCERAISARYRDENRDRIREQQREYWFRRGKDRATEREQRPGMGEKRRARKRAYRKANPELWAKYERIRYERMTPKQARLRAATSRIRYRARMAGATVEPVNYAEVIRRNGNVCYLCGTTLEPKAITVDHVVPLARGGKHSYANLRVACMPCNRSKCAKMLHEL